MNLRDLRNLVDSLSNLPDNVKIVSSDDINRLRDSDIMIEITHRDEKDKACVDGETVILIKIFA